MPYAGSDFPPADFGEVVSYFFDFTNTLAAGETLVTAVWTAAVANNSPVFDSGAAAIVKGSAWLSGNITGQQFYNMVVNVRYLVTATVTTSNGNTLICYSHISCEKPC
jgi:hypothetical protein